MIVFFGQFRYHYRSHVILFLRFLRERGHVLASHNALTFFGHAEERIFHVLRRDPW
jgi:hypothetical protein